METPAEYNVNNTENPLGDRVFKSIFINQRHIDYNEAHPDDIKPVFTVISFGSEIHCNHITFLGSSALVYKQNVATCWIETNNKILIDKESLKNH